MVHVNDLLLAVNEFQNAVRRSIMHGQMTQATFDEAGAKLKTWCEENGLEVDFSEQPS